MRIDHSTTATGRGPAASFTGTVFIDGIRNPDDGSAIGCAHVRFAPGARTAWHRHPKGQTLYVTDGVGWVARRGSRPDRDPARRRGLHRARRGALARRHADRFMAHVALQEADADGAGRDLARARHRRGVRRAGVVTGGPATPTAGAS